MSFANSSTACALSALSIEAWLSPVTSSSAGQVDESGKVRRNSLLNTGESISRSSDTGAKFTRSPLAEVTVRELACFQLRGKIIEGWIINFVLSIPRGYSTVVFQASNN